MIETQTKLIICTLLQQYSKVEKQIEVVRQLLCEQVNFIPFSAFQKLDISGNNAVLPQDLRDFLNNLGFPHTIAETELAISQYDTQSQLKMNYNEFLRATLTIDNIKLRNIASQRTPQDYLQGGKSIPYDVEYTLAKLFELEIRCQMDIEQIKLKLNNQRDYNTANAFASIDLDQNQQLLPRDIELFFQSNNLKVYEDEIDTLFRRIDFDNDGVISFNDFIKATSPAINFQDQKPFDNNISAIGFNNSKGFNNTGGSKSPVKGILKSPQRSVYKNVSPVRTQDSFKYDIQKLGIQEDLEKSKIMNASFQNQSIANPLDAQYQQELLQQSFQEKNRIENEIIEKQKLNQSISKEIEYQQRIKREQDKQLELEKKISYEKQKQEQYDLEQQIIYERKIQEQQEIERKMLKQQEIERQIQYEKQIQEQKEIERQLIIEENLKKQEILKQEQLERSIIIQNMERRRQLEQSVDRMHNSIRMSQNNNSILRNRSPRAGSIVTRTQMSRSPRQRQQSPYMNHKNQVEKQMHKDIGKSQIMDQTYIAQKQTISSKNKYTPKKAETYIKKGFTPSRMPNDYYSPDKAPIQSSGKKKKFTPNKSLTSSKKYNDPLNQSTQQSKNVDNNNKFYNDFSGDKYSKLKANIRGKMANIRQNTDMNKSYSDKKQVMNQSQGSFRPSSAVKSQGLSKKTSAQKVPSSYTKSTIEYDNSYQRGHSSNKKQTVLSNSTKKPANKRQSMGTIDYPNRYDEIERNQIRKQSLSSIKKQNMASSNQSSGFKQQQQKQNSSQKKRVYSSRRQRVNDELIEMIQNVVNQEKKVERYKQDLSLRPDFNLMDIFRYIDSQSRGLISSLLLEDFLKELKVSASIDEIFLFMRRYDTDNDGKLRFSDFAECLTPKQSEYAQIIERREATYPNFDLSLEEILSIETIKLFRTLMKSHLECEVVMENLRKQIQRSPNFDYHEGFKILDIDDDGFINVKKRNGQVITEKEIDYFIARFDKLGDKIITFGEFVEELSPRSIKL